ncbi:MAG: hypothetical protein ABJE95_30280 [Byssovorax sp.]
MATDETHFEKIAPRRQTELRDGSEFDRIAFAMRALRRLRTRQMRVIVYATISTLQVEQGNDPRRGKGARYALVGIPPHASREHIAYALAELAGVASMPFAIEALLADRGGDS